LNATFLERTSSTKRCKRLDQNDQICLAGAWKISTVECKNLFGLYCDCSVIHLNAELNHNKVFW